MKKIVDTHAHLADPAFDADLDKVLVRSAKAGVSHVVTVAENLEESKKILALSERYSAILPAAGLYPTILDMEEAYDVVEFIEANHNRIISVGEVGLDYWKVQPEDEREIQREIFRLLIQVAVKYKIPLNVHARSSGRHAIEFLLENGASLVQMHAYDSKASTAMEAVEAGFYFSIPPSIIRSRQKQKLVRKLPVERILLESDSPVLSPQPEVRNEPANIIVALEMIANVKGMYEQDLRNIISDNFMALYGDTALRCGITFNEGTPKPFVSKRPGRFGMSTPPRLGFNSQPPRFNNSPMVNKNRIRKLNRVPGNPDQFGSQQRPNPSGKWERTPIRQRSKPLANHKAFGGAILNKRQGKVLGSDRNKTADRNQPGKQGNQIVDEIIEPQRKNEIFKRIVSGKNLKKDFNNFESSSQAADDGSFNPNLGRTSPVAQEDNSFDDLFNPGKSDDKQEEKRSPENQDIEFEDETGFAGTDSEDQDQNQ